MRRQTKVFIGGLALISIILVSCGGGKGKAMPAEEKAKGHLVYWNMSLRTTDDNGIYDTADLILNKTIAEFEKTHNCTIEIVEQQADSIFMLFQAAGLAKNGPDVALLWAGSWTNDYKDFIEPLDNYYTQEELANFTDLTLHRRDFNPNNVLNGIPIGIHGLTIFYNKDLFEKAGLPRNAQFKTIAELEAAAAKLAAAGIQPFSMADGGGYCAAWLVGEFLTDKLGPEGIFRMNEDDPAIQKAFYDSVIGYVDFCQTLIKNKWVNADAFTSSSDEIYQPFLTGKSAMRFGGSWDTLMPYIELEEAAGVMEIPGLSENEPYIDYMTAQCGDNLVVTNYSKNKDLAVAFVKALTSKEFFFYRYEQDSTISPRFDVDLSNSSNKNTVLVDSYKLIQRGKNVVGFDSITTADGAAEFYRQTPLMAVGSVSVEEGLRLINERNRATLATLSAQ
jgi:ABC-type glycerol-3-phosphate transport system substrate-binding protein